MRREVVTDLLRAVRKVSLRLEVTPELRRALDHDFFVSEGAGHPPLELSNSARLRNRKFKMPCIRPHWEDERTAIAARDADSRGDLKKLVPELSMFAERERDELRVAQT